MKFHTITRAIVTSVAASAILSCDDKGNVDPKASKGPLLESISAVAKIERTVAETPLDRDTAVGQEEEQLKPGVTQVYQKIKREIRSQYPTALLNLPNFRSSVYPGSIMWWDALSNSQFDILSHGSDKKPFKIAILSASATNNGTSTASFDCNGELSNYQEHLSKLKLTDTALDLEYSVCSASSIE